MHEACVTVHVQPGLCRPACAREDGVQGGGCMRAGRVGRVHVISCRLWQEGAWATVSRGFESVGPVARIRAW